MNTYTEFIQVHTTRPSRRVGHGKQHGGAHIAPFMHHCACKRHLCCMDFVCAAGYTGYHCGPPSSQFPHSSEDGARHKTTRGDERAQSSLHSAAAASMARSVARARRALASILVLPAAAMVSLARLFASLPVFLNREETRRAASSVPSRQAGSGLGRTPKTEVTLMTPHGRRNLHRTNKKRKYGSQPLSPVL